MKRKSKLALLFSLTIGLLIGGFTVWVNSYLSEDKLGDNQGILEDIFRHSNHEIIADNVSCEGFDSSTVTVGSVLATLYDTNSRKPRNMVQIGCFDKKCSIMVSECMPWQSEECNSRFLRFNLLGENHIDPNSFACIDVP